MLKRVALTGLTLTVLLAPAVHGQKATEVFIPIGESPGVSGETSVVGTIESHDVDTRTLTVRADDRTHRARITDKTRIWLDRTEQRETNTGGTEADCRAGRWCEVKYVYDGERRTDEAEWIKIRVGGSPTG